MRRLVLYSVLLYVVSLPILEATMAGDQDSQSKLSVVVHKGSVSIWAGKNKMRELSSNEYTDNLKELSDYLNGVDDAAMKKWVAGDGQVAPPQIQQADASPRPTPTPNPNSSSYCNSRSGSTEANPDSHLPVGLVCI
jgi:hypothetical protein